MSKTKKYGEAIILTVKPVWEVAKGHQQGRGYTVMNDKRTKRQRTRQAQNKRWRDDQ